MRVSPRINPSFRIDFPLMFSMFPIFLLLRYCCKLLHFPPHLWRVRRTMQESTEYHTVYILYSIRALLFVVLSPLPVRRGVPSIPFIRLVLLHCFPPPYTLPLFECTRLSGLSPLFIATGSRGDHLTGFIKEGAMASIKTLNPRTFQPLPPLRGFLYKCRKSGTCLLIV